MVIPLWVVPAWDGMGFARQRTRRDETENWIYPPKNGRTGLEAITGVLCDSVRPAVWGELFIALSIDPVDMRGWNYPGTPLERDSAKNWQK